MDIIDQKLSALNKLFNLINRVSGNFYSDSESRRLIANYLNEVFPIIKKGNWIPSEKTMYLYSILKGMTDSSIKIASQTTEIHKALVLIEELKYSLESNRIKWYFDLWNAFSVKSTVDKILIPAFLAVVIGMLLIIFNLN
jgi:hypothetical protein